MATFRESFDVLQSISRGWKLGREVSVREVEDGNQGKSKQWEDIEAMVNDKGSAKDIGSENTGTKIENIADNGQPQIDIGARGGKITEDVTEVEDGELLCNENKDRMSAEKKQDELEDRETLLCSIKMPPKMLKRARPKGAEVTTSSLFAN